MSIVEEVRRQFREIPGIMDGTGQPDYARCVDISTTGALKEMIIPGLMAVIVPIATGFILGPEALGGLLIGAVGASIWCSALTDVSNASSNGRPSSSQDRRDDEAVGRAMFPRMTLTRRRSSWL